MIRHYIETINGQIFEIEEKITSSGIIKKRNSGIGHYRAGVRQYWNELETGKEDIYRLHDHPEYAWAFFKDRTAKHTHIQIT